MCTPNPRCVPAHCKQRKTAKLEDMINIGASEDRDGQKHISPNLREAHCGFGLEQSLHILFLRSSRFTSSWRIFLSAVWSAMEVSSRGLYRDALQVARGNDEHVTQHVD
jgi:hypothetical protein